MCFEASQSLVPEAPVCVEPAVKLGEGSGPEGVEAACAIGADVHQLRLAENPQVSRHGRLGERREGRDELARGPFVAGEQIEHCAPGWLSDGCEDVHGNKITSHIYKRKRIHAAVVIEATWVAIPPASWVYGILAL